MYVHCVLTRYRKQHFAIHIYQRERLYAVGFYSHHAYFVTSGIGH